ncbi:MAG: hypothetical protein RMK32_03705 [Anaerolineae bacterium]|nr:hypothetical protein [Thermoflexus sp.]MDW8064720.1 hypothetical protein [Anaerolineae bacterium]
MFEDIRRHLSEIPEGETIEESMESRPSVYLFERLAFLQRLTPSQRLILLGFLLADLFLFGLLMFLIIGGIGL